MSETNSAIDVIFFISAKVHNPCKLFAPWAEMKSVKWPHFQMFTRFNRLRNIPAPFFCISAHIAQLLHAGKRNYHFKRASEAELAEEINVERRAGVTSFPQIWRYPLLQITQVWRGNSWRSVWKNSQSPDNEERLSFRRLCDRRQCFPASQLFTAETFAKAVDEEIPSLHF